MPVHQHVRQPLQAPPQRIERHRDDRGRRDRQRQALLAGAPHHGADAGHDQDVDRRHERRQHAVHERLAHHTLHVPQPVPDQYHHEHQRDHGEQRREQQERRPVERGRFEGRPPQGADQGDERHGHDRRSQRDGERPQQDAGPAAFGFRPGLPEPDRLRDHPGGRDQHAEERHVPAGRRPVEPRGEPKPNMTNGTRGRPGRGPRTSPRRRPDDARDEPPVREQQHGEHERHPRPQMEHVVRPSEDDSGKDLERHVGLRVEHRRRAHQADGEQTRRPVARAHRDEQDREHEVDHAEHVVRGGLRAGHEPLAGRVGRDRRPVRRRGDPARQAAQPGRARDVPIAGAFVTTILPFMNGWTSHHRRYSPAGGAANRYSMLSVPLIVSPRNTRSRSWAVPA